MESITHLIKTGLLKDLHIAERSFCLNKKIKESQNELKAGIKADISKILYNLTYTEMLLSLSRLYDKPDKSYPTICLKRLYALIEKENYQTELKDSTEIISKQLHDSEWCSDLIEILKNNNTHDFNKNAINFFETEEINDPIGTSILKLKEIRDKFLAHNEDVSIDTYIPYQLITILIDHAKDILSFFSLAYSGVHLRTANGKFYLSQSSFKWERIYKSFLKETYK